MKTALLPLLIVLAGVLSAPAFAQTSQALPTTASGKQLVLDLAGQPNIADDTRVAVFPNSQTGRPVQTIVLRKETLANGSTACVVAMRADGQGSPAVSCYGIASAYGIAPAGSR